MNISEEEVRDFRSRAESTLKIIQEGGLLTSDSDRSALARRIILLADWGLAQRDENADLMTAYEDMHHRALNAEEKVVAQRDVVAAQKKALDAIADNARSWHGDDAAKGRALAVIWGWARDPSTVPEGLGVAAVVSGTPPPEEQT